MSNTFTPAPGVLFDAFTLPPGAEPVTAKTERLEFRAEPGGTRRLTRIERVAHVEQTLTVNAHLPRREVELLQRFEHPDAFALPKSVRLHFAPEEARHIAACLIEAADAVEAAAAQPEAG